jgi:hypothetical protein
MLSLAGIKHIKHIAVSVIETTIWNALQQRHLSLYRERTREAYGRPGISLRRYEKSAFLTYTISSLVTTINTSVEQYNIHIFVIMLLFCLLF